MSTALTYAKPQTATDRLHRLIDGMPDRDVTLGAILDRLGPAGTGLCLLTLSLLALVPGVAPLFGIALAAVALGMVLGRPEPFLPDRMRRWTVNGDRTRAGLHRLSPAIAWLERHMRPRAGTLLTGAGTRATGIAAIINAILIVLPIPFGNTAPAIAMLILSAGVVIGDGYAVAVGLGATLVAIAIDIAMVAVGYEVIVRLVHTLF